jgi:hypothetical protein
MTFHFSCLDFIPADGFAVQITQKARTDSFPISERNLLALDEK